MTKNIAKVIAITFSGTGITQMVMQQIISRLDNSKTSITTHALPLSDTDFPRSELELSEADLLIMGFPCYYLQAPFPIRDYIRRITPLLKPVPVYLIGTKTAYSGNMVRNVSRELAGKNLILAGYKEFKTPGNDASLQVRNRGYNDHFLRQFGKGSRRKRNRAIEEIQGILETEKIKRKVVLPKWYSIPAWLLQHLVFNRFANHRNELTINGHCTHCGTCIRNCPFSCWKESPIGAIPVIDPEKCILCLRCIHNCPEKAISWPGMVMGQFNQDDRRRWETFWSGRG